MGERTQEPEPLDDLFEPALSDRQDISGFLKTLKKR